MGRNKLPIWKEFDVVNDKKYPDVECRHCAFLIPSAQPSRGMIRHLKICEKLTSDDRNAWILRDDMQRDEKERKLKSKLKGQVHIGSKRKHQPDTSTDDEDSDPSSRSSSASTADSHTNENWTPSEGEVDEYHMLIAKFFYVNGLAFRLIDDQLAKAVLTAFCPKMPLPTRQQLAGPLLDRVYDEVRQETIKTLMKQGNVALVSDGWSNARREQVINFVLTAPKMSPILWSTQTTGEASKTGEYIADMVSEEIKDIENVIGTGKVCGLTTDNAANMVKAWKLLEKSRPNFYCGGCGSHTKLASEERACYPIPQENTF
ncbi:hypothetical protein L915_21405 [Phytophthora nicotianae]|uniref:DUF659 domain-containing protein n=1 Tax=Phytophthora nicotianae TaxID=4792 RepID=W2FMS8_PHYNI|nr:hypothetical protein L915_21405 [Phytophthora nicotianae]